MSARYSDREVRTKVRTEQSSDTPISESKDATLNELFKPYLEDQHRQGRSGLTLAI